MTEDKESTELAHGETRPVVVQIVTTVDSIEVADKLMEQLVSQRLAACVQCAGPITSQYMWRGEVKTTQEWTLICKTTRKRKEALVAAIRAQHPYDIPELLITKARSDTAYATWVAEQVGG